MILGIVGGLSPETTSEFYLKLIEKSRKHGNSYLHITIDSVPLDFLTEDGLKANELLPLLVKSVKRLQNTDCIVIPCNTAHIFIEDLRRLSEIPVISIVEEVITRIKNNGYRKVGILATSATAASGIYSGKGVEFVLPSPAEQDKLSEIIVKIIRNECTESDKAALQRVAFELCNKCDAIVLACTDLQRVLKGDYIDSLSILAEAVFERLR